MKVTGEQVKAAAMAAGITEVEHHACSGCRYMTKYVIVDGQLYFDAGCYCTSDYTRFPRSWASAADWINMQDRSGKWGDVGAETAAKFGLTLKPLQSA